MDNLTWLTEWYAAQCDGDWEHQNGVRLDTLDNPGWALTINLEGTPLEDRPYSPREHNLMSDVSWWTCSVKEKSFEGRCGPRDLQAILAVFRKWAEPSV